jgi:Cdc6-like AAA superfamily ATPase
MRNTLVSTGNVLRIMDATKALEQRLRDQEIVGIGLVYGHPGLGKTMTVEHYHSQSRKRDRVRTYLVRALAIWTEASMLKDLLLAMGIDPREYRKDLMFDTLKDALTAQPAIFLIDEADSFAESRRLVTILKDLHDVTGCCFLLVGEQRVESIFRRYTAFYNRINTSAIVNLTGYTQADVEAVIEQRCEIPVELDVCAEIYRTNSRSMRSVIDTIRAMERYARTNSVETMTVAHYRAMLNGRTLKGAIKRETAGVQAAIGGTS